MIALPSQKISSQSEKSVATQDVNVFSFFSQYGKVTLSAKPLARDEKRGDDYNQCILFCFVRDNIERFIKPRSRFKGLAHRGEKHKNSFVFKRFLKLSESLFSEQHTCEISGCADQYKERDKEYKRSRNKDKKCACAEHGENRRGDANDGGKKLEASEALGYFLYEEIDRCGRESRKKIFEIRA